MLEFLRIFHIRALSHIVKSYWEKKKNWLKGHNDEHSFNLWSWSGLCCGSNWFHFFSPSLLSRLGWSGNGQSMFPEPAEIINPTFFFQYFSHILYIFYS